MQRSEAAHREAHNMGLIEFQRIEDRLDVIARTLLRIHLGGVRHVGWGIAAGIKCDAAIAPAKKAKLAFPRSGIACVFVHKDDWRAGADILIVQLHAIVGGKERHIYISTRRNWIQRPLRDDTPASRVITIPLV